MSEVALGNRQCLDMFPFDRRHSFVLLEDRLAEGGRARLYREPVKIVRCDTVDAVDRAFRDIQSGLAAGLHAAGFYSYELGHVLESCLAPLLPAQRDFPLLWFGLFPPPIDLTGRFIDGIFADLGPPSPLRDIHMAHDRASHAAKVEHVLERIIAGDIYQANLTFPIRFRYDGDPLALYGALRSVQPVSHGCVVSMNDATIASVSPELFIRVDGRHIEARPMKGTTPRGTDRDDDARLRAELVDDPKQRAENLMILDLLRNDLARISEAGSVRVPALFTPETYPSFHALTSTITATLRPGISLKHRMAALFPCGSVVGAPKIRAAEIIADVEDAPRGVYTGSIGAIAPNGDMDFNVAIRTAIVTASGAGRYDVGGGIVADSNPDTEYNEALLKARILTDLGADFELLETFRWSAHDGFVRLPGHLARLERSAAALGFTIDPSALCALLEAETTAWQRGARDMRVRATLARDGSIVITSQPLIAEPQCPTLGIARHRLDPADPYLRHKTTRRAAYEAAFAEAQRDGHDEALLLNHRDVVADGSRNTIFVCVGEVMLTPRVEDGALPGVLREQMVALGQAVAAPVTLEAIVNADRVLIGNSLHGLRVASTRFYDITV